MYVTVNDQNAFLAYENAKWRYRWKCISLGNKPTKKLLLLLNISMMSDIELVNSWSSNRD